MGSESVDALSRFSWLYNSFPERRFMMHIVKIIERRFPNHKRSITTVMVLLSVSLLLLGLGLLFLQ